MNPQLPPPATLELPSDTRLLALATAADTKLQNQTANAQFAAFQQMNQEELMAWVILHT